MSNFIVCHGGTWNNNKYEGGVKDYIPIPCNGIKFDELLAKLEIRMKKDRCSHGFDIDYLVEVAAGESMRMKITDEFEWSWLLGQGKRDYIIYVDVYLKCNVPHAYDYATDSLVVPTLQTSTVSSEAHPGEPSTQWLLPGASQQASIDDDDIAIEDEDVCGEIAYGSTFFGKDILITRLGLYHLKNGLECRIKRSDSKRYHVVCKFEERCSFTMRSRGIGKAWRIYEFVAHDCERDMRRVSQPKASSKVVAAYVAPNMSVDGHVIRPKDLQGQLLRDFGLILKYSTALSARNRALIMNYGDPDLSFQMLRKYLYMVEVTNPGSIVDVQIRDDGTFEYCFFCLEACIRAFRFCRPVIVVDATHLKGKYKGVLFVASTKDGNEQVVPLAFGVGDKENDSSWTWFLQHVRESLGCPENLLVVSDQHLSIKNAMASVYPGTPHGLCTYHIQGNLKSWGEGVIEIFQFAATAYKLDDFEAHMNNLELTAPGAYAKLMGIDPIKWAACKSPVRRYRFGTSNAVEVLNARLKWARKLPICSLMEYARNLVQAWFCKRRAKSAACNEELSLYAAKRLHNATRKGRCMKVEPISDTKFNITSGLKSNIVDIDLRECSCKVFQMDLIPCSHAAAAICHLKQAPVSYVHAYYNVHTWREIYTAEVIPVPDPADWRIPDEVASIDVGTPKNPRQAGRPRESRLKAGDNGKGSRMCSRCHQRGHYQSRCTTLLDVTHAEESSTKRPRAPKKCGICGVVGHTRRRCNDPHRMG